MTPTVKLTKHLMRGDVIRTPDEFLDPLEDAQEHVVVEAYETDYDGLRVQVEPNPFEEPWAFTGDEQIFVYREGAEVETPRHVKTDEALVHASETAPGDGDDPLEALKFARARLRALGYVLGAVRLDKFRKGDVLMVNGAGTMLTVESVDGQRVEFEGTQPALLIDPGQPFLCLRPVKS